VTNIPAPGVDPPDRIELRGLRALGTHGVLPEERERAQPFEVDIDLEVDLRRAGRSDDLADTIDYGAVAHAVAAAVGGPRLDLLESLAERIAGAVVRAAGSAGEGAGGARPEPAPGPSGTSSSVDPAGTRPAGLRVVSPPPPIVTRVTVAVRKLHPPVAADLGTAGVRIHRYPDELSPSLGSSAPSGRSMTTRGAQSQAPASGRSRPSTGDR
jgi:dihydroneopterin aldolase